MGLDLYICEICGEPITEYDVVNIGEYDNENDCWTGEYVDEDLNKIRKIAVKHLNGDSTKWCGCNYDFYNYVDRQLNYYQTIKNKI